MQHKRLGISALGHAVSDGLVNFVPPLWYVVRTIFSLSDSGLGVIMMLFSGVTNFGQPIFGYLTDRLRWKNVIGLGILLSVVTTCFLGFIGTLWVFVLVLLLSGIGTALFHPQGGGAAAHAAGHRRAFGMSIFGLGGAIGYALGALVSPALHNLGLSIGMGPLQGFVFVLPVGLASAYVLHVYSERNTVPAPDIQFHLREHLLPYWRSITPILGVMVLRAMTVVAFASFYQVVIGDRGLSVMHQGGTLFAFVFGGAFGGIIGARLSELWGRRFVTIVTMLLSPPVLYAALYVSYWPALVLLFIGGFILRAAEPINIAQTQDLVPEGISMASSIGMGLSWGIAGVISPCVGWVSDATGDLQYALAWTTLLPFIGAAVGFWLPSGKGEKDTAETAQ
ncbi:MAG: MFS transporter [Armatimonadota bacterium]